MAHTLYSGSIPIYRVYGSTQWGVGYSYRRLDCLKTISSTATHTHIVYVGDTPWGVGYSYLRLEFLKTISTLHSTHPFSLCPRSAHRIWEYPVGCRVFLSQTTTWTTYPPERHIAIQVIAELQRAKRASEAPWVRKTGNYQPEKIWLWRQRTRVCTSVQTRGEGEGRLEIFLTVTHTGKKGTPWLEKSEKYSFLFAMSTNDREVDLTFQGRV